MAFSLVVQKESYGALRRCFVESTDKNRFASSFSPFPFFTPTFSQQNTSRDQTFIVPRPSGRSFS